MARSSNVNAEQQTKCRVRKPNTVSIRNAVTMFISPTTITLLPITLLLSFATFNVRGLTQTVKQHQIGADCVKYNLDSRHCCYSGNKSC